MSLGLIVDVFLTALRLRYRQAALALSRAGNGDVPQLPQPRKRTEMDTLFQDLRYALRQFVRRPGFTAIAVASLGLAIGGNSLIYGMLDGFVFRPFPYPQPDRLVAVGVAFPKLSSETNYVEALSPAEYIDIRSSRSFAHAGSFDLGNRNISGGDVPERVFTALLLDDLFPVIGMAPHLGRGFTAEELGPNGPPAAIISHRLWQTRFAGDPAIINRAIRISGRAASVVGVMPPGLVLIGTDLWIPWGGDPLTVPRNVRQFNVLARLAPDASLAQANAELDAIARRVEQTEKAQFAEYENWRLTATPWAAALLRDVRPAAFVLLGAVGLVLFIACANLTNLFLARSSTRQRELAVRLALGAAPWRVTRLLLAESLLLATAGAAVGLVIAWLGLQVAGAIIPAQFQMLGLEASINLRVLGWSLVLAVVCGFLIGVLPAVQATRTDPHESLKADARTGGSRGGQYLRQALVVAELALSVVLLLGAGLLMRSFLNIQRIDRGFDPRGVLTMRLTLPRDRYPGDAAGAFFDRLAERLAALPGVRAVSAASQFPPSGTFGTQFRLERGQAESMTLPTAQITTATPSYFETLGVPIRAGRGFMRPIASTRRSWRWSIQAFANRYFGGSDPIGQRLSLGSPDQARPWMTIVGVVADYRNNGITQPVRPESVHTGPSADRVEPAVHAHPNRWMASEPGVVRAPDSLVARSRATRLHDSNARRRAGHVVVSAAAVGCPRQHLCRRCAGTGGDWHLRRHVLCSQRADAGDRRAACRRRTAPRCRLARARPGAPAVGRRVVDRNTRARPRRPGARRHALRRSLDRPRHDRGGRSHSRHRGARRRVGARIAREQGRSDSGVTDRVGVGSGGSGGSKGS